MGGQSTITNTFANVPSKDILGAHLPNTDFNKITFEALNKAGFQYDDSWNTKSSTPYLPHTLDYKSDVVDIIDNPIAGFWEIPNVDWIDMAGNECSVSSSCVIS